MNKNEVKVSVIVTVHNSEKYIGECMESVLRQTLAEIEILCMDGGSIDNTPQILRKYAEKDCRVRIINDTNTSYGHKVNRGIQEARGKYIAVLESDDMYETFMLERLYPMAEQYQTDFVNADYTSFFDVSGQRFFQLVKMYSEENYNCLINYKKYPEQFGIIPRYWTGLFSKEFLVREDIKMNESPGASYQDMSFRFLTSILAQRAYHLNIPVYLYRIDNLESSMYDAKKTIEIAEEHDFLKKELVRRNISNFHVWRNAYQWKYIDFRGNMRHLRGKYRQELFRRYLEELDKDRMSLERYGIEGYNQNAVEMIKETPEKVMQLIESDAIKENERRERLLQFLDKVIRLDETKRIVIFGCGKRGKSVLTLLKSFKDHICCLADNSELLWNTVRDEHKVLPPEDAVRQYPDAFYVVANKKYAEEIICQLKDMGILEDMIGVY